MKNIEEKIALDTSIGVTHCENCLHEVDMERDCIATGDIVVMICPGCGEALDKYGWSWE